ncbi:hypothetical protein [Catelliglobosispora koreensis]|uniref:hypothetical protein n=1 Tax=Catelliglobosispora koreensis TaxID=129052 RepID=UPI0003744E96|nr:hypothetical protein [Catelliglobosispora koreensis]
MSRKRFMHWLWDGTPDWLPGWLRDTAARIACLICGHEAIADQCCNPEHDFCAWCQKSMPHQAS